MTQSYLLLFLASHVLQALQDLHLVRTHRLHLALELGPAHKDIRILEYRIILEY